MQKFLLGFAAAFVINYLWTADDIRVRLASVPKGVDSNWACYLQTSTQTMMCANMDDILRQFLPPPDETQEEL